MIQVLLHPKKLERVTMHKEGISNKVSKVNSKLMKTSKGILLPLKEFNLITKRRSLTLSR